MSSLNFRILTGLVLRYIKSPPWAYERALVLNVNREYIESIGSGTFSFNYVRVWVVKWSIRYELEMFR